MSDNQIQKEDKRAAALRANLWKRKVAQKAKAVDTAAAVQKLKEKGE